MAEATERRPAQGVVLPGPALVLVIGPDLHPAGQVHFLSFSFLFFFLKLSLYLEQTGKLHSRIKGNTDKNPSIFCLSSGILHLLGNSKLPPP